MTTITMVPQFQCSTQFAFRSLYNVVQLQNCHNSTRNNLFTAQHDNVCGRLLNLCSSSRRNFRCLSEPISASGSGVEVSTSPKDKAITIKDAKVVVESQDDDKIQLRVDLTGNETQKVFTLVLRDLARSTPPIPGFRRQKGGKTSKVPTTLLLQAVGEERVTKFVIQEILRSTLVDYVTKENLDPERSKITTVQSQEELRMSFAPGNVFGFNATIELGNSEAETTVSSSSEN